MPLGGWAGTQGSTPSPGAGPKVVVSETGASGAAIPACEASAPPTGAIAASCDVRRPDALALLFLFVLRSAACILDLEGDLQVHAI